MPIASPRALVSDVIAVNVVDEAAAMVRVYFCWGFGSREIEGFTGPLS
jgi:hypothetical protein